MQSSDSILDSIPSSSLICAVKSHVCCSLGDEAVILHMGKGVYHGLNEVAAFIWYYIQEPRTFEQIVHKVTEQFEVGPSESASDAREFVLKMREMGLIEITEGNCS